jgi:hypothetical protein
MLKEMRGVNGIRKILDKDLKSKKMCAHFVPHLSMQEQKHCAASSVKFSETTDDDRNVLKMTVIGDGSK